MKRGSCIAVLVLALFMGGCGIPNGIQASINRANMSGLSIGMDKEAALKVMGKANASSGVTKDGHTIEYLLYTTSIDSPFSFNSCRSVLEFVDGKLVSY